MSRKETLSLDEFATAPRKQAARPTAPSDPVLETPPENRTHSPEPAPFGGEAEESMLRRQEARKALREVKRERMKGVHNFVNVYLDRDTKRRLKLASFSAETTMQSIMESAIRKYLNENGF